MAIGFGQSGYDGPASRGSHDPRAEDDLHALPPDESIDEALDRDVARDLTGDLPCVSCSYNLRGLSVSGSCPECGLAVRATLLAVVDPRARELQTITRPRLTAVGLVVWAALGLLAVLGAWALRVSDVADLFDSVLVMPPKWAARLPAIVVGAIVASGAAALVLVRPHARIPRWQSLAAIAAVALYAVLACLVWRVYDTVDGGYAMPYSLGSGPRAQVPVERSWLRVLQDLTIIGIALGLKPNTRVLALRSMLMRTGRQDRQTMIALAAAASVTLVGDLLRLGAHWMPPAPQDLLRLCGSLVVGLGSLLLTIGLFNVLVDTIRLWPVVIAPPLSLEQALGEEPIPPGARRPRVAP